jgi:hypothetical protein
MALSWIAVLKSVPWSEVIRNAPKVADAAKKLWSTVARQPGSAASVASTMGAADAQAPPTLDARLAAAEAALTQLQSDMLASSELIKTLAEQNTELVRRIEANRIRVLWLALGTVLACIVAMTCLISVL